MKTDQQLKDDVENELRWEPSVDSAAIGVAVNGTVILRGSVSSLTEAQTAKSAAWAAPGVSEVRSYLEVQPMSLAR
jgi:osmotically-inducible protein OsmY